MDSGAMCDTKEDYQRTIPMRRESRLGGVRVNSGEGYSGSDAPLCWEEYGVQVGSYLNLHAYCTNS